MTLLRPATMLVAFFLFIRACARGPDSEALRKELSSSSQPQARHLAVATTSLAQSFQGAEYAIPPKIFLTSRYHDLDAAPQEVRDNLRRTLAMNPGYNVTWFDDAACLDYMQQHAIDPKLVKRFEDIRNMSDAGMYRSDICRAAYLFKEGGFYTDLDVETSVPFAQMVDQDTGFMSAWANGQTGAGADAGILNAIIGVAPGSPIIQRQVELMLTFGDEWFKAGRYGLKGGKYFGPSTLGQGLREFMGSCHDDPATIDHKPDFTACGTKVRMFEEEDLQKPSPSIPHSLLQHTQLERGWTGFRGHDYALFYTGHSPALIGFPRYSACKTWGCGSFVAIGSFLQSIPKTSSFIQSDH